MKRHLTWTSIQTEVKNLLLQGKTTKELKESGHSEATIKRVRSAIKDELAELKRRQQAPPAPPPGPPDSGPQTRIKPRTLELVEVGALLVEPADWRINQYGLFLILNTHDQAKQKFGYEGTVGEFLCDATQMVRKIMGLDLMEFQYFIKEGDNGTGNAEKASEGGGVSQEGGNETDGGTESGEIA